MKLNTHSFHHILEYADGLYNIGIEWETNICETFCKLCHPI